MGNPIRSVISGVGHVVGSLFGAPLDFLSGKSCNSLCAPTWDLPCYIENFCIQHLIKLSAVSLLFYIVLLFFYSLYKLRICHCVSHMLCKLVRAIFSSFCSVWENACHLLCDMLRNAKGKRRRRRRDVELGDMSVGSDQETDMESSISYRNSSRRRSSLRDHKRNHFKKSLKPKTHRLRVGVDGDSVYASKRKHIKHGDVRVHKTSSFARKGVKTRNRDAYRRSLEHRTLNPNPKREYFLIKWLCTPSMEKKDDHWPFMYKRESKVMKPSSCWRH